MATFTSKPEYVDFGFEPSTKTVRFTHDYDSLAVTSYPSWVSSVTITDDSTTKGYITLTVGADSAQKRADGVVTITGTKSAVDTELYIQVIYSYDSEHVPLDSVVDNVILMAGETSYITERDRMRCKLAAKRWLADNGRASGLDVRLAELPVDGGRVNPPADFVDYIGVYRVTTDGFLLPLYRSDNLNKAEGYKEDQDGLFVTDQNGFVVGAYGATPRTTNEQPYTYYESSTEEYYNNCNPAYMSSYTRRYYNIQGGELSNNGLYKYDMANREFMVDGVDEDIIVIKYISDPILRDKLNLDSSGLRVHKNWEEALEYYVYHKLVEQNKGVSYTEKRRAKRDYAMAYRRSKARSSKMTELEQVLRGNKRYFSAI